MNPAYFILIVAPLVLALLIARGYLRGDALDRGPCRNVGFILPDILIAFGLMMVGGAAGEGLMRTGVFGPIGTDQEASTLLRATQVLVAQTTGQLPAVLYFLIRAARYPHGLRRVGAIPRKPVRDLRWGVLALLAAAPLVMGTILVVQIVNAYFGHEAPTIGHDMLNMLLASDSPLGSALIICSAVLVAPVVEEVIFRGLIQSVLVEWFGQPMRWGVVLLAALVFALIHFGSVPAEARVQVILGLFVLGVILGWLYERTGSLWPSIIVHVGFNALNVCLAFLNAFLTEATP